MKNLNRTMLALVMVLLGNISWAQNTCGNAATPPTITTGGVVPPGNLEMQGVEYVAGDAVRVQLLTDGCTQLESVQIGSTTLTPAVSHSGTLPQYYWYSSIDTQNNASGHGYLLWVGFPQISDGSTDQITLTVVRTAGTGTASYSFPLVHVSSIQAANTDSAIGISGVEIHNLFAKGLHDYYANPKNSLSGKTRIDYEPQSLDARIDSTGIWLSFRLKAETTCKPVISVNGTFVIDTNTPGNVGLSVRWVNPPTAHIETTWCIEAGQILHDITLGLLGPDTSDRAENRLTALILNALPDTSAVNLFLDGTINQTNQLLVNVKLPAPSVEIDVPYSAFDVARTPTRFPPGQVIALIANGLGMSDYIAGESPSPTSVLQSGPNGVPENSATTLSNEYTVLRTAPLIDPFAAVGQLLARYPARFITPVTQVSDFRYTKGCKLTVPSGQNAFAGPPEILFGVNDTTADAQRLRTYDARGYKLRILFGLAGGACPEYTPQMVNQP